MKNVELFFYTVELDAFGRVGRTLSSRALRCELMKTRHPPGFPTNAADEWVVCGPNPVAKEGEDFGPQSKRPIYYRR